MTPSRDIARLIEIMAALRTPRTGCPWDLEQNFATIAPYTLEEAYEVADAIDRGDLDHLKDELGDLLLQVVFHARMAEEQGLFAFEDVVEAITTKLIRRHPHVFADADGKTADAVKGLWERIKAQEKADRGEAAPTGALAGVPVALPALTRALKLQNKAGHVGFDWNDPRAVLAKIREEADEIEAALDDMDRAHAATEVGDLRLAGDVRTGRLECARQRVPERDVAQVAGMQRRRRARVAEVDDVRRVLEQVARRRRQLPLACSSRPQGAGACVGDLHRRRLEEQAGRGVEL